MNRKLHNTILAFSVTGVMLFVGLVVAEPALPAHDGHAAMPASAASFHGNDADAGETTPPSAGDADTQAADAGDALAMATGLLALSVTEAALKAVLADVEPAAGQQPRADRDTPREESRSRRKPRASRELIAVPYFSFARGSRGSRS